MESDTTRKRWPKDWLTGSPGKACPTCKTKTGRPVLYGLPSPQLGSALSRGEIDVVLGGCIISGDDPKYICSTCGTEFHA